MAGAILAERKAGRAPATATAARVRMTAMAAMPRWKRLVVKGMPSSAA
jgi:hypothetical protein